MDPNREAPQRAAEGRGPHGRGAMSGAYGIVRGAMCGALNARRSDAAPRELETARFVPSPITAYEVHGAHWAHRLRFGPIASGHRPLD